MKNILITTACLMLLLSNNLMAQNARFATSGTIEYEKAANMFALISKTLAATPNNTYAQQAFDQYKKTQPQFKKSKSTLIFGENKTLFTPQPEPEAPRNMVYTPLADQNSITQSDLTTGISISQKKFFDESFLVKDTIRSIKWKITDETRDVAGYPCRRANGLALDSIYVVAFYTDKIPVAGGPEAFSGLPGMILLVSLPHENVTWTATKVTDAAVPAATIIPPKKGKPVDNKGLREALKPIMRNAGPYEQIFFKAMSL